MKKILTLSLLIFVANVSFAQQSDMMKKKASPLIEQRFINQIGNH